MVEELIADPAFGCRKSVILTVQTGGSKSPVDVLVLHGIGNPFSPQNYLIPVKRPGGNDIGHRVVGVFRRAIVQARVEPAVKSYSVFSHIGTCCQRYCSSGYCA